MAGEEAADAVKMDSQLTIIVMNSDMIACFLSLRSTSMNVHTVCDRTSEKEIG